MNPSHDAASAARMRICVYDVSSGGKVDLPAGAGRWFVYAPNGRVSVVSGAEARELSRDDGVLVETGASVDASEAAWIFEIARAGAPFLKGTEIARSEILRPRFPGPYLMRADRIESPPGAATPRHGHRGPGMRRLIFGRLMAEIGETVERLEAGYAWFETGADMVVGTNLGPTNAAFVRVMVLPIELSGGKSSFMAENAAEAAKPRAVQNRLFGEVSFTDADIGARS